MPDIQSLVMSLNSKFKTSSTPSVSPCICQPSFLSCAVCCHQWSFLCQKTKEIGKYYYIASGLLKHDDKGGGGERGGYARKGMEGLPYLLLPLKEGGNRTPCNYSNVFYCRVNEKVGGGRGELDRNECSSNNEESRAPRRSLVCFTVLGDFQSSSDS